MSLFVVGSRWKWLGLSAFLWFAMPTSGWAQVYAPSMGPTFGAPCASCAPCQTHHCPPAFKHCYEGAPHIHWKRGCPHPICNPCDLPHFGYFETCYSPWPFPPNWGHCPTPVPAAFVTLNPMVHPNAPVPRPGAPIPSTTTGPGSIYTPTPMPMPMGPIEDLPQPRRVEPPR